MSFLRIFLGVVFLVTALSAQSMTCWFVPGSDGVKCKKITDALSNSTGLSITPRVATNYPEIFNSFSEKKGDLVFAGSFTSALLVARGLIIPLIQKIDGKEYYSGILIYPKHEDPAAILLNSPADISYAIGASSGESSAKAATGGKASVGVKDHIAAVNALKAGKTKAAFVKDAWWDANKDNFPEFSAYKIPGISEKKNPDNILSVSATVKPEIQEKIINGATASKEAFGATSMEKVDPSKIQFSLELMRKGGIDPKTYSFDRK